MTQIVSDKDISYYPWLAGALEELEADSNSITKLILISITDSEECNYIIDFMNCDTNDLTYAGAILQKEATKRELIDELGLEDEGCEYTEV